MKLPKELINGIIIFVGIAIYFFIMEVFGLTDYLVLRAFNAAFVFYGATRTLSQNIKEGKRDYATNLMSAGLTTIIGVVLSVIGLLAYIHIRGGDQYIENLSQDFLFGGNPTANEYCVGVLIEGLASAVIMTFVAVQFWRKHFAPNK